MGVLLAGNAMHPRVERHPAPGIVFPPESSPGAAHELASRRFCAGILSDLLADAGLATLHVPRDTVLLHDLAGLGIDDARLIFGGVVPHAFLATKVIGHPLVDAQARAPRGWSHALAARMAPCVLPGYSVFAADDLIEAFRRIRAHGQVRVKCAGARGGHGQACIDEEASLLRWMQDLQPVDWEAGLVVEPHLEQIVAFSIGAVSVGAIDIAYSGFQYDTVDGAERRVYGGSRLHVVRGTLESLQGTTADAGMRAAIAHARRYEAAVRDAFPDFFATRRNYDIIRGVDGQGRTHCGVLEQSWRLGGASPAEVLAMRALVRDGALEQVEAATCETYDPAPEIPAGAEVHFQGPLGSSGILTKFASVRPHGNPA